jgi:hypothetical protein
MQYHNSVFHISNLKPCHSPHCPPGTVPARIDAPPYEFIVDAILDFRIAHSPDRSQRGPRLEFLTHWDGYDTTHDPRSRLPTSNTWRRFTTLHAPTQLSPACSLSLRTSSTTANTRRAFGSYATTTPTVLGGVEMLGLHQYLTITSHVPTNTTFYYIKQQTCH